MLIINFRGDMLKLMSSFFHMNLNLTWPDLTQPKVRGCGGLHRAQLSQPAVSARPASSSTRPPLLQVQRARSAHRGGQRSESFGGA